MENARYTPSLSSVVRLYYWVIKWNFFPFKSTSFQFFMDISFWPWDCKCLKPFRHMCTWHLYPVLTQPWRWVIRWKVSSSAGRGRIPLLSLVVTSGCARCGWQVPVLSLHPLKRKMVRKGLAFAEEPWRLYTVQGSLFELFKGDLLELASLLGGASCLGPCLELLPRAELALDVPEALSEAGLGR